MSNKIKAKMEFFDNTIEGTFILPDKSITSFFVDKDGEWEQWGNTRDNLTKTVNELVNLIQLFYYTDK